MPARSSMTMVMKAWALWNPRALVRSRPNEALLGASDLTGE
jgi:hypothetical protein